MLQKDDRLAVESVEWLLSGGTPQWWIAVDTHQRRWHLWKLPATSGFTARILALPHDDKSTKMLELLRDERAVPRYTWHDAVSDRGDFFLVQLKDDKEENWIQVVTHVLAYPARKE